MGDPRPLSDIIDAFVGRRRWRFLTDTRTVTDLWNEIASEGMKQHCSVHSCVNGVLELYVDSALWSQEVRMLSPELVDLINRNAGKNIVKEIMVRIRRDNG